jgi:AraC-like DNA-binding protein
MQSTPPTARIIARAEFNYRPVALRLLRHLSRIRPDHDFSNGAGLSGHSDTAPPLLRQGFIRLLNHTRDTLQDDLLGFTSRPVRPGTTAMLVELALGFETLGAGIQQALRFARLVLYDLDISLENSGDDVILRVHMTRPDLDPDHFLEDYWLTYLHRNFSWMVGRLIPLKRVELSATEPPGPSRQSWQLRGDWQPGAHGSAVVFNRRHLSLPILRTRRDWEQLMSAARTGDVEWPDDDIHYATQVRVLIHHALQHQQPLPTLEQVAGTLHLTAQTLRRHLQREGHGFQNLLNQMRRDTAIDKLSVQQLSVGEVAAQLGFSEPRSFSRAFKEWTGKSPSDYCREE